MKTYEAMFLLDNREVKKGWEPLKESVDSILTKRGAEIVVAKRWDERKLAYEIKKQRRATYYLSYLKADPSAIDEIRRDLELSVPVLRYLILSCDAIPEDAYEPEREFTMVEDDAEATESSKEGSESEESSKGEEGAEATEGADVTDTIEAVKAAEGEASTEVAAEAAAPEASAGSEPAVASEPADVSAPAEAEKPEENKE